MSSSWAETTAFQILQQGLLRKGSCLIVGASDTGKTTIAAQLARQAASDKPVGIVDADTGQSHIGPPTTVGWAVIKEQHLQKVKGLDSKGIDLSALAVGGISFVGDITPMGHLLQLTAAVIRCVHQAARTSEIIIVDTPGFVKGPAASALWWTVHRILQPELVLAVQRYDELEEILKGLDDSTANIKVVSPPAEVAPKSPQSRREYRREQFRRYFSGCSVYEIDLNKLAVQSHTKMRPDTLINRLVAIRDINGVDDVIGFITDFRQDKNVLSVKAPQFDERGVSCIVIGDAFVDTGGE